MEPFFGQITFVIFLAVSSLSTSDLELESESENIDANATGLLSPLSLPETYLKRGALPPTYFGHDSNDGRKYRLEDFMWTGSGEGPIPSDQDGGLAWEDNNQNGGQPDVVIRVTSTMVLYSTVLTTIYPVELTPTVIISSPRFLDSSGVLESSHFLESSFTPSKSEVSDSIQPTPTFSVSVSVAPTVTVTPGEDMPSPTTPDHSTAPSTNRLYWVNTVIKANGSKVKSDTPYFQEPMQEKLARVYASAFKRHLLNSLGVMKKPDNGAGGASASLRRRRRRRSTNPRHQLDREELDFEWMFLREQGFSTSQIQSLATTMMNVSVAIVNITSDESDPRQPSVSMNYIVSAEGKPIAGSSAVQDLNLITKFEMEQVIGYDIITKAEALVSLPAPAGEMSLPESAQTSVWFGIALAAICAFILSLIGLTYLAWKSKRTAISDDSPPPRAANPQPGIEGGVINPAFLGSPHHAGRSVEVLSETSPQRKDRRTKKSEESPIGIRPDTRQKERQKFLASELSTILSKNAQEGQRVLPSSVKSSGGSSPDKSSDSASSQRTGHQRKSRSRSQKDKVIEEVKHERPGSSISEISADSARRRRQRRKTGVVEMQELDSDGQENRYGRTKDDYRDPETVTKFDRELQKDRPLSAASRDKITLGHLDMREDSIPRSSSEKARKARAQAQAQSSTSKLEDTGNTSQKDKRRSQSASSLQLPETIDEVTDLHSTTDGGEAAGDNLESLEEKDREISESLEEFGSSSRTDSPAGKKDAQVQTPTRSRVKLKTKVKPKPRVPRPAKMTSESVFKTETEETFDMSHFEESSVESNPLGRMRQRFHQFLDDAFNVMGKKEDGDDHEGERPKSAKVSISHELETRDKPERPWTTHVIHEESVHQVRPKSATIGPPKRAWTDSSERRCHSAKSQTSKHSQGSGGRSGRTSRGDAIMERDEKHDDESDLSSTTVPTTTSDLGRGQSLSFGRTTLPIFPHYPIYPDIPMLPAQQGPSHSSTDPAVPLIQAIKEEIKRFEKVKVTEQHRSTNI